MVAYLLSRGRTRQRIILAPILASSSTHCKPRHGNNTRRIMLATSAALWELLLGQRRIEEFFCVTKIGNGWVGHRNLFHLRSSFQCWNESPVMCIFHSLLNYSYMLGFYFVSSKRSEGGEIPTLHT